MPVYFVYDSEGVLYQVTFLLQKAEDLAAEENGYIETVSMILCSD